MRRSGWDIWTSVVSHYTNAGGALWLRYKTALGKTKKKKPALKLLQRALHEEWNPTLLGLRPVPSSVQKPELLAAWELFGATLGLVERDERAVHEKEGRDLCARIHCEFHRRSPPSAPRQCAGCGQVVCQCILVSLHP